MPDRKEVARKPSLWVKLQTKHSFSMEVLKNNLIFFL